MSPQEMKGAAKGAAKAAVSKAAHFLNEIWRVRWMLIFGVSIVTIRAYNLLPEESTTLKTLYRPAIGTLGFIAAHIGFQQAFPYINTRDLLFRSLAVAEFGDPPISYEERMMASISLVGVCILRATIYGAFILGTITAV